MRGLLALVAVGAVWASLLVGAGSAFAATVDFGTPPANTTPPVITGTPEVGQTLSCSQGSWDNLPSGFAYQWNRDGVAIAGATSTTYVAVDADAGHQLTCSVTASNAEGSNTATSAALTVTTATVPAAPTSPGSGGAPAALPPLPKAAEVIQSPSNKRCASRRKFRIRVRRVQNVTFVSARVFVNGKQVKVVSGERLTAPVNLRGLPAGRFAARIEVTISDGRNLTHTRKYRTCTPKRGGKRKHRL